MKIGFNAQIVSPSSAGVANYAKALIEHLVALPSPHAYTVFGPAEFLRTIRAPGVEGVDTHPWVRGNARRIAWEQTVLPFRAGREGVDVMLYPDHVSPLMLGSVPSVITIHDLAFLAHPEFFRPGRRLYKSAAVRRSVRIAREIVAVSRHTKDECVRLLGVPAEKITVVHNGVDAAFRRIGNAEEREAGRRRLLLTRPFLLFVGTLEPRKNIARLVEAYGLLRQRRSIDHELVIAGGKGWLYDDVFEAVRRARLATDVRFLGHVPQTDLVLLYNLADAFVYPSLYEGFGFPPLEAMACGCPVVVSDRTSLPEVVGDAALMVNPESAEELAAAIMRLLDDRALALDLGARGVIRAGSFRWESTARGVLSAVERAGAALS